MKIVLALALLIVIAKANTQIDPENEEQDELIEPEDIPKLTRNQICEDNWKANKCKKKKKKGKCNKKKVGNKCKKTCGKCTTIPCPGDTIPNADGNCVCPGNTVDDGTGTCFPIGTKIMITSGVPQSSAIKTEVVDVVNGESCADLADFPFETYAAVGTNLHVTPILCGGYSSGSGYLQTCYKYTTTGWQQFASMNEKRGFAAGITYKNKFHVFGGYGGSRSKTTELISIDGGVEYGPELPEAGLYAITSINSTVSLLSGGDTDATNYSPLTWYFNHETNVFSSGPSLLVGRRHHGSATIVDKVTKEKIPMVTGGYNHPNTLDSTELLINGQWQSGPALPKALYLHSMLEIHGDAFVFGGRYPYNSAIYKLTCSSGVCSWSTLNQELKVARDRIVAIPVPDTFCV